MFESFKGMGYALKYGRNAKKIEEIYQFCLKNSHFQCRYCKKELGLLDEIPVMDFLRHLKEHPETDQKEIERFLTVMQRVMKM